MKKRAPLGGFRIGVLTIIAAMLTIAGFARLGIGIAGAFESVNSDHVPTIAGQPELNSRLAASSSAGENSLELFAALRAREARVMEQEDAISIRMAALAEAEARLSLHINEMVEAEASLAATLSLSDNAAENDLARLTSVFENMRPEEAAILFEEMDAEFSAGFIARLRPDIAAALMAGLSPQRGYAISAILAGRHTLVPTR
jgi:flagellar motility protein MotE (MotC chaperone)